MQKKSHQNPVINHQTNSLTFYLSRLNYNQFFNFFYNFLAFTSVFYVIFVIINHEITQTIVILDLIFLFLFSFELIVRYFSVRNLKKFWKIYYLDIIALIGWIPLYYLSEFAILRSLRLLRLLTIVRILATLDKKIKILIRNILIIFVITVLLIILSSLILSFLLKQDSIESLYWSLYVIFAGEIPEGFQNRNTFWIGMMLIASNGLLLAGIIGSVSSYIMEKFKNITDFDNLPNSENLVIIFNYDKEIIFSLIKEHFETNKNNEIIETKVAIISQMNDEDYKSLFSLLENLKNFEIVNQNTYIINENPLLPQIYEKLLKIKEKIKRTIILPDERIIDEYHKDTNTAFIAMNILNYLGKNFARKKLFVLTNTDIVNIPNAHVVRSYEIISKLINIEISIPHIGLVEQFLLSFHNRLKEIPVEEITTTEKIINTKELIEYINKNYGCTLIGYLDSDNKFINLLPMYQKTDIVEYSQIKSFLVMK